MKLILHAHRNRMALQFFLLSVAFLFAPAHLWCATDCDVATFSPPRVYPTDGAPFSVVVGDFNGDSKQDFVVDNNSAVIVYLGDGLGGFLPPKSFFLGGFHESLTAGDFNGDGKPDLALPNYPAPSISILLNDGGGGFGPAVSFGTGDSPRSIGVGDFNGDGKRDLAVVNGGSNDVSILLGNGAGGFGPPANFPAGIFPYAVAAGDFDEDGNLDLAVSTYGSQEVRILLGDGSGKFTTGASYSLAGNSTAIVAADFNHDSHPDLAVSVFNNYPNNHVAIFLGDGSGGFTPGAEIIVPNAHGLAAADFNFDGELDVAVATYGFNTIAVASGDGTGNFGPATDHDLKPGRHSPFDVAAGDFNGDGKPDVVTANYGSGDASVLLNLPNVKINVADSFASESDTVGRFRVTRTGCTAEPLLVHYTVGGTSQPGTDYKELSGQVVIEAGRANAPIRVVPLDDTIAEPVETVIISLSPDPSYGLLGHNSATVAISDND